MALSEANRNEIATGSSQAATHWQDLNRILVAALDLEPSARREFLRRECVDNSKLLAEAEKMLDSIAHVESESFLAADAFAVGARVLAEDEHLKAAPNQIGPYKILQELGRGGMGAVFLAERTDPRQLVAIKIIKRGMDTDEIISRFRRERQFLAALDHPNIARLLDAATTPDGVPYFVMEYVKGVPITEFCDLRKLGINERLGLFQKICAGVACCHRNLIVHRDIKPSNILVTEDGQPKLMDFGIAKLLATELGDLEEQTVANARLFTPEYASPEQIRGEKITTASDIYALGLVLYELLSGHRPFRLRKRLTTEVLDLTSRKEPVAPSSAIQTQGSTGGSGRVLTPETLADSRSEKISTLRRKLSGDLDNITLKALRQEPERRYQTVEQFSDDIRRHLVGMPVLARPDSFRYRATKFVGRNRIAVALTSMLLLALSGGIAATVWASVRAERHRAMAQQRAAETRRLANSLLTEFDDELENLASGYPTRIKLAKASSAYLDALAQQTDDPEVMKELVTAHLRLGRAYQGGLSDLGEAQKHWRRAEEIARRQFNLAPNDPVLKELLANSLASDGFRGNKPARQEALKLREEIVALRPGDHLALKNLADSYVDIAAIAGIEQKDDERLEYYRKAIETRKRAIQLLEGPNLSLGEYDVKFWSHLWNGLDTGSQLGDWKTMFETCSKALEIGRDAAVRFPDDKRTQTNIQSAHGMMARALVQLGDYSSALEQYQLGLQSARDANKRFNVFGAAGEVRYLFRIAEVLVYLGERRKALETLAEAGALRKEASERDYTHPRTKYLHGTFFREVGDLYVKAGDLKSAIAAYDESERSLMNPLKADPGDVKLNYYLAVVAARRGDLVAQCDFGGAEIRETNPAQLKLAYDWYKRATDHLAKDNLGDAAFVKLVGEKLRACTAKLGIKE